ncbi:MAG: hypothetical protein JNM78_13185 [Cyclobacteriaceae bacterium]|nr:hypothetical protein [Cyclobacteriaceae bacterium]
MKHQTFLTLTLLLGAYASGYSQSEPTPNLLQLRKLTIEPGVGIHTNFGTDFLISNLVQWNPTRRFVFASYSNYSINNIAQRNFNHVKTNYNYSWNQKFGLGTTVYSKHMSHTFLLMAGVKYTAYKETLDNPNFDTISISINALSPDYGMMYSLKKGWKKYFFTSRFYLPLSPWLTKGAKIENVQGTLRDVALEFGMGIKIK